MKKGVHLPPYYYGYKGGFDNINYCEECDAYGLSEDFSSMHPCPFCGGKVKECEKVGRWIKPVYKTNYILFLPIGRTIVTYGYWEFL